MLNLRVYLWLGVLLAAAAGLSFSHFTAYRAGKANVRNEWAAATAAANLESRALEQHRQRRADEAAQLRAASETRLRGDLASARGVRDGLLDTLNATQRYAEESHAAASRATAALDTVFRDCTRAYLDMAETAQRHADDSLMLQRAWPK
jgi:tryptophan 2,3-dioxygenase